VILGDGRVEDMNERLEEMGQIIKKHWHSENFVCKSIYNAKSGRDKPRCSV
jgi:hypothetical protein